MKISIIGTGIYSIALALNIAENNHEIIMWSENQELVSNFQKNHDLKPITDAFIPNNINITNTIEIALKNSDLIILATSAKFIRSITKEMALYYNPNTPICIASKGIENNTCAFLSDIVEEELHTTHISVISGPTFAVDLINKEPCALSLASLTNQSANVVIQALQNNHLKLRKNTDIYGTELCGSIKNVFAIASGILEGLGYSESYRAFFLTEVVHDLKHLLKSLNCDSKTILSYAGLGDLILTCSSSKSRNYQFGKLLGAKKDSQEITTYLEHNTTEGYYTLLSIKDLLTQKNINMPIIELIYDIAINNKNPELLSEFLIKKD